MQLNKEYKEQKANYTMFIDSDLENQTSGFT